MSKKHPTDYFSQTFPLRTLLVGEDVVSFVQSPESLSKNLSLPEQQAFSNLLEEAQIKPKQCIGKVKEWKAKYPHIPEIDNLLAFVYLQNKESEKAEQLIESSYFQYPHYFFAKINYADQCLRKKKIDKIPSIFPSFNLKELFPGKKDFHVSEFRGFMVLMSRYHMEIGQPELAKSFYEKAYAADPSHPSVVLLEKKFFKPSAIKKIWLHLQKLAGISQIS
jgi:tetratricopeptide (TPR) repeat protein